MPRTPLTSRTARSRRAHVLLLAIVLALAAATLGGCGGRSASARVSAQGERAALVSYLRQVEPIRLAVTASARWALVEAAWSVVRQPGPLHAFYARLRPDTKGHADWRVGHQAGDARGRAQARRASRGVLHPHGPRLASRHAGISEIGRERDTGARITKALEGQRRAADHEPLTSALRLVIDSRPPPAYNRTTRPPRSRPPPAPTPRARKRAESRPWTAAPPKPTPQEAICGPPRTHRDQSDVRTSFLNSPPSP
jgi:hypothetical protein